MTHAAIIEEMACASALLPHSYPHRWDSGLDALPLPA